MSKQLPKIPIRIEYDPGLMSPGRPVLSLQDPSRSILARLERQCKLLYIRLNDQLFDTARYQKPYDLDHLTIDDVAQLRALLPRFGLGIIGEETPALILGALRDYLSTRVNVTNLRTQDKILSIMMQNRGEWDFILFAAMNAVLLEHLPGTSGVRLGQYGCTVSLHENEVMITGSCPILTFDGRHVGSYEAQLRFSQSVDVRNDVRLDYARTILSPEYEPFQAASMRDFLGHQFGRGRVKLIAPPQLSVDAELEPRREAPFSAKMVAWFRKAKQWVKANPVVSTLIGATVGFGLLGILVATLLVSSGFATPLLGVALSVLSLDIVLTDTAMIFLSGVTCALVAAVTTLVSSGIAALFSKAEALRVSHSREPKEWVYRCKAPVPLSVEPEDELSLMRRDIPIVARMVRTQFSSRASALKQEVRDVRQSVQRTLGGLFSRKVVEPIAPPTIPNVSTELGHERTSPSDLAL